MFFDFSKNQECAIAIQTILILAPGIFNNACEQASNVEPVVITSSINKKCLLWFFSVKATSKMVSIPSLRFKKFFLDWVLE